MKLQDDDDDGLAPSFPDPPREPRRNSDPMPTPSRGPSRGPSRAAPSRAVSRARSDQDTKELEGLYVNTYVNCNISATNAIILQNKCNEIAI